MDFIWNVTGRCNLACPHCWDIFKDDSELTTTEGKQLIDLLVKESCEMLLFTGGEPLIRDDFFQLVNYAAEQGIKNIKLCSNGLLAVNRIEELKVSALTEIHISLDDTLIETRDFRSKNDQILQAIHLLNKELVNKQIKIVLVSVIHPRELDRFKRVLTFAQERGFFVSFQFPYIEDQNSLLSMENLSRPELEQLFSDIEELLSDYKDVVDFFARFYLDTAKKYYLEAITPKNCAAGTGFTIISPKGERYPCYWKMPNDTDERECFSAKCLVWFRSPKRAQRIMQLLNKR